MGFYLGTLIILSSLFLNVWFKKQAKKEFVDVLKKYKTDAKTFEFVKWLSKNEKEFYQKQFFKAVGVYFGNKQYKADIIVYGCNSAGVVAAVQAARMGKSVIVVGVGGQRSKERPRLVHHQTSAQILQRRPKVTVEHPDIGRRMVR